VEVGRKENRTSERIQVLGLHFQRKSLGQGTHERDSEEGKEETLQATLVDSRSLLIDWKNIEKGRSFNYTVEYEVSIAEFLCRKYMIKKKCVFKTARHK
jgi:hypothetical protein